MSTALSSHPDDATLKSYALGLLDENPANLVDQHLEQCDDCRLKVTSMSADSFLDRVRDVEKGQNSSPAGRARAARTVTRPEGAAAESRAADVKPTGLTNHPGYEIRRELGRGGMGVVYLAHNSLMGRDEVLKVMGQQIIERPGVLERFLREIRAVAKLRHPNIVTAYAATRVDDSIVFAMEYVEGLDLAKLVKAKGPVPIAHACNFIYQAALGLQHAHEEGLVHRDIKPGNLMLSRNGNRPTIKVLDFGLSKVTREEKVDSGLTFEGQALGTPDFIAPEQIIDAPSADIRADIYSLGGTLYYLLTGRPPFLAKSLYDIYQAHISRDADPLNLIRPEVPSELAALVAKMMSKDPARRFQTPGEVAQALIPFFKKGIPVVKSSKPEVSRLETTRQDDLKPTIVEPRWESLIEFREPEGSAMIPIATSVDGESGRRGWGDIAGAAGAVTLVLGIIIIIILSGKGSPDAAKLGKTGGPPPLVDPAVPKATIADGPAENRLGQATTPPLGTVLSPAPFDLTKYDVSGEGTMYGDRDDPRTGKWYTEGDELVMRFGTFDNGNPPRATVMFGDPTWTDYDFSFKVRHENTTGYAWAGFYLVFRSSSADNRNEYMVQHTSRFPMTLTRFDLAHPNGQEIGKDGDLTKRHRNLIANDWYRVRAEVRGDHIKCFFGNEVEEILVFDVIDDKNSKGRVGIKTLWSIHHFKDIKVTAPDGQILWEGLPTIPPLGPKLVVTKPDGAPKAADKTPANPKAQPKAVEASVGLAGDAHTNELIRNPGGEEPAKGNTIPSWTSVVGDWSTSRHDTLPFEGKVYFSPGAVPYAELFQMVDVSQFDKQIDRKKQSFRLNARVRSFREGEPDWSQIVVRYFDKTKTKELKAVALPGVSSVDAWQLVNMTLEPPAQTRFIKISLKSHRLGATEKENNAVFDGLSLKAIPPDLAESAKKSSRSLVLTGNWHIEGDELVQTDRKLFAKILLGTGQLSEYKLKYKVKLINSKWGPRMLSVFHLTPNPNQQHVDDQYWFEIKEKPRGDKEQLTVIYSMIQGKGSFENTGRARYVPPLSYDRWYDVELQITGTRYKILLEGQKVFDENLGNGFGNGAGWVGLGSADSEARFKEISITNSRDEVIWKGLPDDLPAK